MAIRAATRLAVIMVAILGLSLSARNSALGDDGEKLNTKQFEEAYGLSGLLGNKLKVIDELQGKTFTSASDCCKPKGKIKLKFIKAYKGTFPFRAGNKKKTVRGIYISTEISADANCCKGKPMKLLQLKRQYKAGKKPKKKWKIDASKGSPYLSDYEFGGAGKNGKKAFFHETPGRDISVKNQTMEYATIILCDGGEGKDQVLATFRWGFTIDGAKNVIPLKVEKTIGAPDDLGSAVRTWNRAVGKVKGRISADVEIPPKPKKKKDKADKD